MFSWIANEILSLVLVIAKVILSQNFIIVTCVCIYCTDSEDPNRITDKKRKLGLIVVRGTQVSLVSPEDGMEEIANPFIGASEE